MNNETAPAGSTPAAHDLADAGRGHAEFDAAAVHARSSIARGPRGVLLMVIALTLVVVAFWAGGRWSSSRHASLNGSSAAPTSAPATTQAAKPLWTCSMHPQVIQDKPGICPICHMELTPLKGSGGQENGGESGALSIDPTVVQNMGIRTAAATRGPLIQSVRAVGYLEEPEPLHRDINLRVGGWIEKLYANVEGMAVTRGMPLFDLYSPELAVAIDELIAARRQAEQLPADATAKSLLETGRRKLLQYGLEASQIDAFANLDAAPSTVAFLSPLEGHLTAKMVYEGASVKAGDLVLRLANRHNIWIDAQIQEQQMSLVSDGQPVRATVVSQPARVFKGKVLFVHPHVDPQTRTALARIEIDNADMTLRQGMYATVDIAADAYREATLIPREAVIDTGRRQLVFVSTGEGHFAPRDVRLGLVGENDTVEVIEGLQPAEHVVTSGQFLLDSESRLKEAVAKHLTAGLGDGALNAPIAAKSAASESRTDATPDAAPRIAVPHADEIVSDYLALSEKLGARQETDEPLDPSGLLAAATMAAEHAETDEAKRLAAKISTDAGALVNKPLAEQRKAFVTLSESVIALARRAELTRQAVDTLYVMHCPMAFEDAGANWLQVKETIENPFYATEMKRCGEITGRVVLKR